MSIATSSILVACGVSAPTQQATSAPPAATRQSESSQRPSVAGSFSAKPADSKAASPAASSTSSVKTAPADWQPQWDRAVAAAKQEGKVAVVTSPGDTYRQVLAVFEKQFGIRVELLTGAGTADILPRIQPERQAGRFLWDVAIHAATPLLQMLGELDGLAPALILPEVLDDSKWVGGLGAGWQDIAQTRVLAFVQEAIWSVHVNRDVIPESQLSTIDQVWDAKWKGRIAMNDSRNYTSAAGIIATWLELKGEDKTRAFLRDQQPTLTQDRRQLVEWVVRGQYPIGIGLSPGTLTDFAQQGVNIKNIRPLDTDNPASAQFTVGTGVLGIFTQVPHPNATKVLVNWLLSKEGQSTFAQLNGYNSRRVDVAVADESAAAGPDKHYLNETSEAALPNLAKAVAISKEVLK